jgi:hypothetical protein
MGAANPAELGWSIQGLANAYQAFATLTPASMVVIDRGRIVIAWGDIARRVKVSSVRKSLLSALYGTPVRDGRIKLDDTLEKLEIDDDPPLTHGEKQATLRMLSSRTTVEGRVWFVAICRGMTAVAKRPAIAAQSSSRPAERMSSGQGDGWARLDVSNTTGPIRPNKPKPRGPI